MYGTIKKLKTPSKGFTMWVAVPLLLALVGCEKPVAKIGAVLPLTGPDAAVGQAAKQGLEASLAALGETSIILEIADSKSDPQAAAAAAATLIENGAVAVVGGATPHEARSLAKEADAREQVLILTSATEQSLSQNSKWVYRLAASDAETGAAFATFGARRFKTKTAVILARDAAYAAAIESGFVPTFKSLEGELLATLEAGPGELEARADELAGLSPGLAILSGDADWLRAATAQLRAAGYRGHLFASRHLAHPGVVDAVASIPGLLLAHSGLDLEAPREGAQAFLDGFTAHHGEGPAPLTAQVSAEAWDALQILALALRDRPAMASEIRRGLRDQVKSYAGASGSLEFDDTGAVTAFPRVYSLNADGGLRDHGVFLDLKEERIAEERRALKEKLESLQAEMHAQAGG